MADGRLRPDLVAKASARGMDLRARRNATLFLLGRRKLSGTADDAIGSTKRP
jgi:hypothetical protein